MSRVDVLTGNDVTPHDDHGSARRLLRSAVRCRDVVTLRKLVHGASRADLVDLSVGDRSTCAALAYAVGCGHLEIVETLIELPICDVDRLDRARRSPLDLALHGWLVAVTASRAGEAAVAVDRHDVSRRYRIVRRLLEAGARKVSGAALDSLLASVLGDCDCAQQVLAKLVNVFCASGCRHVRSVLLGVLFPCQGTSGLLTTLLRHNARPVFCLSVSVHHSPMPLDNAAVLIRSTGNCHVLSRIDRITGAALVLDESSIRWSDYRLVVGLLTVAGHRLQLHVLNWLFRHHANVYRWAVEYWASPRPLGHLARVAVRSTLRPNVLAATGRLRDGLPTRVRQCLLLDEMTSDCFGVLRGPKYFNG